jgi:hypothetical protein
MIACLVACASSQLSHVTFLSIHPQSPILDFGFESGGRFRLEFEPSKRGRFRGFFLSASEARVAPMAEFPLACSDPDFYVPRLRFANDTIPVVWEGSVAESGVHTLYFWNCESNRTSVNLRAVLSNPTSRLDTRHAVLPRLYLCLSAVYAVLAQVWGVNALCFLQVHVSLHTLFAMLPIVRSISLAISGSFWLDAGRTDDARAWKSVAIAFFEFTFYTLTLAGISFACAGFCIYRQKFRPVDRLEIVGSAMLVTGSILSVQLVSSIQHAFLVLGSICFSVMWYLKQGIMSIVIVTQLLRHVQGDPQVTAKVTLSRNFVVDSATSFFLTLAVSSLAVGIDLQKWICATILEVGMIANTLLQMCYFLLRKKYVADEADAVDDSKPIITRPVVVVEPARTRLVMLTH